MAPMYNLLYNIIMDLGCKRANDLISKNPEVSRAAARAVVDEGDIETFEKLCEKSEFLFDFIKEKIVKNLCGAVNKGNLQNIFKFTKIYSSGFESFIVNSWVKFANEDLTDEILALFEEGDERQKAHAAAYFCQINDPVSIEFLEKYAYSDFEPLAQNCALALSRFGDKFGAKRLYNEAISAISNPGANADTGSLETPEDDFENYKHINFLVSYGEKAAFDALFQYFKKTCTKSFTASNILYLTPLFELTEGGKAKEALEIFDAILGAYPEEISLETVFDFEILEFLKYLLEILKTGVPQNIDVSYIKRLLLKAKYKFNTVSREDIYTFDLSKEAKKEVASISGFLNTIEIDLFSGLEHELTFTGDKDTTNKDRVFEAFDVILNFGKKEFSEKIAKAITATHFEDIISEGTKVLKIFGRLELVQKEDVLNKIKNENLKALTESYFG